MPLSSEQKRKIAEAKREYHREWRAKNKERIQDYNARYWLRKVEESKQETAESEDGGKAR